MNIKLELLKGYISDFINSNLKDFEIDATEICNTNSSAYNGTVEIVLNRSKQKPLKTWFSGAFLTFNFFDENYIVNGSSRTPNPTNL
ncbi:MAG: hypothetical protein IKA17_04140 [Clostridia bacterium]|nr:hypothetical protein [Clostridia bacterium]